MAHVYRNADKAIRMGGLTADTHQYQQHLGADITNSHSVGLSVADRQARQSETMKSFFGIPTNPARPKQDGYEQEFQDFPEAFSNDYGSQGQDGQMSRNAHMSRVLIEKTKATDAWPITTMAPWVSHNQGGLVFSWDEMKFNRHMLDREPEESTPRLLTSTRSSGSASMVRYGIALMLESGFASTPAGRATYNNNLEQIRIATVETVSYGAVVSVVEHDPYVNPYDASYRRGVERDKQQLDRLFKEETAMFGMAHKDSHGFSTIVKQCDSQMQSRPGNPEANFTIIPKGMGSYLAERDAKFYMTGNALNTAANLAAFGSTIVESRTFSMGEHTEGHDPLYRHVTIGGFATFSDAHLRGTPVADYTTSLLDCLMYDEDSDDMFRMIYSDLYQNTGVWNFQVEGAPLTDIIGLGTMNDLHCYTWGQILRSCTVDHTRAVAKIEALSPFKRREFLSSLKLLPAVGDRRTSMASTGDNFDDELFRSMNDSNVPWDVTYTIDERRGFKHRLEFNTGDATQDDVDIFQAHSNKRRRAVGADRFYTDSTSGSESEGDEIEYDARTMSSGLSSRAIDRVVDRSARVYATHKTTTVVRKFKSPTALPFASLATTQQQTINSLVADLRAISGTKRTDAELQADFMNKIAGNTVIDMMDTFLAFYINTIVHGMRDAEMTERIELLTQLRKVAFDEMADELDFTPVGPRELGIAFIAAITAGATTSHKLVISRVASCFTPSFRTINVILCARGIVPALNTSSSTATVLEKLIVSNKGDYSTALSCISDKDLSIGWWNPSASAVGVDSEDGQLALAMFYGANSDNTSISLEHDSLAVTLTHAHSVLFKMTDVSAFNLIDLKYAIKQGTLKRSRMDALVYSITLSLVAGGYITDNASAGGGTPNLSIHADTAARLKRAHGLKLPLLPIQAHLHTALALAYATVDQIITDGTFARCVVGTLEIAPYNYIEADDIKLLSAVIKSGYNQHKEVYSYFTEEEISLFPLWCTPAMIRIMMDRTTDQTNAIVISFHIRSRLVVQLRRLLVGVPLVQRDAIYTTFLAANPSATSDDINAFKELIASLAKQDQGANAIQMRLAKQKAVYKDGDNSPDALLGMNWTSASIMALLDRASLVSGEFYRFSVDNDIPLAFMLTTHRPSKTYDMGSVVRMVAGENGACKTPYKNPDFMMADNAAQKTIYGHFTLYSKTVVFHPEKIVMAQNVYARNYIGGNGVRVWNPLSEEDCNAYRDGNLFCDMFVTLAPMKDGGRQRTQWKSLTGTMPKSLGVTRDVNEEQQYPGCSAVSAFWGWKTDARVYGAASRYRTNQSDGTERKFNVIEMQELQLRRDPNTKLFTDVTRDCGHWGDKVYAGCGEVRTGRKCFFETPWYFQTKTIGLH